MTPPDVTIPDTLRQAVQHPGFAGLEPCHNLSQPANTLDATPLRYSLNVAGYDRAIGDWHKSAVWLQGVRFRFDEFGHDAHGLLEVRQVSMIGNADEEKAGDEYKFGNLYVTVKPAATATQCIPWSPKRILSDTNDPYTKAFAAYEKPREHLTGRDTHFPKDVFDVGKYGAPEAGRILPGPYQTHPPVVDEAGETNNQCEWGPDRWAQMVYDPGLPLVFPDTTPGFQKSAYLCIRIYEGEGLWDEQPILQAPILRDDLTLHRTLTIASHPTDVRTFLLQPDPAAQKLIEQSTFSITLGLR